MPPSAELVHAGMATSSGGGLAQSQYSIKPDLGAPDCDIIEVVQFGVEALDAATTARQEQQSLDPASHDDFAPCMIFCLKLLPLLVHSASSSRRSERG